MMLFFDFSHPNIRYYKFEVFFIMKWNFTPFCFFYFCGFSAQFDSYILCDSHREKGGWKEIFDFYSQYIVKENDLGGGFFISLMGFTNGKH